MRALASSCFLLCLGSLSAVAAPPAPDSAKVSPGAAASWTERKADEARVEQILGSLTLRQKIGQLLLAYPQINKQGPVEVGGVLFVGNTLKNIETAKTRIATARQNSEIPPFFAVDIEGGSFNRLQKHPLIKSLPLAKDMAALPDREVERWGRRVGQAMREVGLNMNLAPVFDVAPSGHMFQNGRAFSGDPATVKKKTSAFARGLARAGVVAIGKHFPGYGDIADDSDHAVTRIDWDPARVKQEAEVYQAATRWLGGVMMSNIVYTRFGSKPAILEASLVQMAHRGDWLSITDDVSIQALADQIGSTPEEVFKLAFLAGNDLILTTAPPDWSEGLDYFGILTKLAASDPSAPARIDEACRRVLRLKDRMGLLDEVHPDAAARSAAAP